MRRHQAALLAALVLALLAAARRQPGWLAAVILLFGLATGLGVALPRCRWFGDFICRGPAHRRRVAFTFDDGPDPRSTPRLLELLRAEGVPAAFFCIGKNVAAHPGLAARIQQAGHLLGNHSQAHSGFINFYPAARLRRELSQAQAALEEATGVRPVYYRPPVGLTNPGTFRVAAALRLQVIGWTVRSLDTVLRDPARITARITRGLRPGAIILLHDGNIPADRLLATVKSSLDSARRLGYEIVRLDDLLT